MGLLGSLGSGFGGAKLCGFNSCCLACGFIVLGMVIMFDGVWCVTCVLWVSLWINGNSIFELSGLFVNVFFFFIFDFLT